jgi:hypothetical protein
MASTGINLSAEAPADCTGKVENIQFSVDDRGSTLTAVIQTQNDRYSLEIDVHQKFQSILNSIQKKTREMNLHELEKDALINLVVLESQNLLICEVIRDSLKLIESFNIKRVQQTPESTQTFTDFAAEASKVAESFEQQINSKFDKLKDKLKKQAFEVFERDVMIKEAQDQLLDNLKKQFVLVVTSEFEHSIVKKEPGETPSRYEQRQREATPSHPQAEAVSKLISDL